MTKEDVARICHEANAEYCRTMGDYSQAIWNMAEDWQKESAIKGVQFILDQPNSTPEETHESWLREKEATGWKYGPVKNPETKEHPCFVPYNELPAEQRAKDHLFRGIVHALAPFIQD